MVYSAKRDRYCEGFVEMWEKEGRAIGMVWRRFNGQLRQLERAHELFRTVRIWAVSQSCRGLTPASGRNGTFNPAVWGAVQVSEPNLKVLLAGKEYCIQQHHTHNSNRLPVTYIEPANYRMSHTEPTASQ